MVGVLSPCQVPESDLVQQICMFKGHAFFQPGSSIISNSQPWRNAPECAVSVRYLISFVGQAAFNVPLATASSKVAMPLGCS